MAQQCKDSQDGFLSFSISPLSQGLDAESSLALEGLVRDQQSAAVSAHRPCQNWASSAERHWCLYVPPPRYPYTWNTSPVPITTDKGESAVIFYVSFQYLCWGKKGGNHSNFIYYLCNTRELFLGHLSSQLWARKNSVAIKAIPNMEKQY